MATFKTSSVEDLKQMLHEGIVEFLFIKKTAMSAKQKVHS